MQQLIGVGVLLVARDEILLGKRSGSHGAGTWALPGGHLESGELIAACAVRETFEETGIKVTEIRNVDFTNHLFEEEGRQYITLFVEAVSFSGTARVLEPQKCEQWR